MPLRRLLPLVAGLLALALAARATGLTAWLHPETLQAVLVEAGPLGAVGFLLAFALGTLASIPGVVFIVAALLAWGPVHGGLIAMLGAVLSAALHFCTLRRLGGPPAAGPASGPIRWALDRLEQRPVAATAALRALTVLSPPVNLALAVSPIRGRDHLVGTALGLAAPIAVYALSLDCVLAKVL